MADHPAGMKPRTKHIAGAVFLVVATVGYVLFLWKGPWWIDGAHLRTKNLQPADGVVITGFRTMLVAMGAGAVAALGLYYTRKSHKQTEALFEHTREKDREQAELTREGQVTDRYVEAIKLLSSENLTQRLGGIYSLERIMRDSEKDHATVVEVLAAFVRQCAPERQAAEDELHGIRPPDDVQAALKVVGRRPVRREYFIIDLARTDLQGANLVGAHLRNVDLTGANLCAARLGGADLKDARLTQADLRNAHLHGAELQRSHLVGARLERANFSSAILEKADLVGARLNDAHFEGAHLTTSIGLYTGKLVKARVFSTTRIPKGFESDPRIQERVRACDESPVLRRPAASWDT